MSHLEVAHYSDVIVSEFVPEKNPKRYRLIVCECTVNLKILKVRAYFVLHYLFNVQQTSAFRNTKLFKFQHEKL